MLEPAEKGRRLSEEEKLVAANYLAERLADDGSPFYGITLMERDLDTLAAELPKYGLQGVPIGRDAAGRGRLVSDMKDRLHYIQVCNAQNFDTVRQMIASGKEAEEIKKWLYTSGGYNQLSQVVLPGYTKNMRDYIADAYLNEVRAGFNKVKRDAKEKADIEATYAASNEKEERKYAALETYRLAIPLARRYPQVAKVLAGLSEDDLDALAQSLAAGDVGDTISNPMHMRYLDAVADAVKAEMAKPVDLDETLVRDPDNQRDPVQAKVRKLRMLQAAEQPQRVGKERRRFFVKLNK